MTVQEYQVRKKKLEENLAEAISALVRGFNADTGTNVRNINVNFVDVSVMRNGPGTEYVVGLVRTSTTLDS